MHMKRILFAIVGTVMTVAVASAQMPAQTFKGTVIDNMCFGKANMKMSQAELAMHSRECALMDGCVKSGYALVTADGHVYKLDADGNKHAVAALKASKQEADLKVTVTGTNNGGTVTVKSVTLDKAMSNPRWRPGPYPAPPPGILRVCMMLRAIVLTAVIGVATGFAHQAQGPVDTSTIGPSLGATVPAFSGVDQFGKPHTLASSFGPKGTMLVFFRSADW